MNKVYWCYFTEKKSNINIENSNLNNINNSLDSTFINNNILLKNIDKF